MNQDQTLDVTITEHPEGGLDVDVRCKCGKPIEASNRYGMYCEDFCGLEQDVGAFKGVNELFNQICSAFGDVSMSKPPTNVPKDVPKLRQKLQELLAWQRAFKEANKRFVTGQELREKAQELGVEKDVFMYG